MGAQCKISSEIKVCGRSQNVRCVGEEVPRSPETQRIAGIGTTILLKRGTAVSHWISRQKLTSCARIAAELALGVFALTLTGCYTLRSGDIFEVGFKPISAPALNQMSDAQHRLRYLPLTVGERRISAYWDDGRDAHGVLLFFNGNGYGAEAALRRMLVPARTMNLDLLVFNYFEQGEPVPTMTQMRAIAQALYAAAATLPTPAAKAVYVGGHSLGATFALDVAARDRVAGTFVAAPTSTGVTMLHHQLPYTYLVWLRPDDEYAQFDNLRIAPDVRTPILVVGSDSDEALPPIFTRAVFDAIPVTTAKRLVILKNAGHSEYFADELFWQAVAAFFAFPAKDSYVGFIPESRIIG
jgi:pimeloyl-ACP methyl ester carboxylesterase